MTSGAARSHAAAATRTSMSSNASSVPTSPPRSSPTPSPPVPASSGVREARSVRPEDLESWHGEILKGGKFEGRTFADVYDTERQYCKFLVGKLWAGDLRDESLIEFANYTNIRLQPSRAYMVRADEVVHEDSMVAVIDTGCNNTCHGAEWMEAYT